MSNKNNWISWYRCAVCTICSQSVTASAVITTHHLLSCAIFKVSLNDSSSGVFLIVYYSTHLNSVILAFGIHLKDLQH